MISAASPQMSIEETRDFAEGLGGFRRRLVEQILRVRLSLVDVQRGLDASLAQLSMDAHGVAQEEIASPGRQNRRGKPAEVAVYGREPGIRSEERRVGKE